MTSKVQLPSLHKGGLVGPQTSTQLVLRCVGWDSDAVVSVSCSESKSLGVVGKCEALNAGFSRFYAVYLIWQEQASPPAMSGHVWLLYGATNL